MAAAIQFFIAFALAMLAFWILEISTVVFILYSFEYFLSGRLFPLDTVPGVAGTILRLLPFPYELYFPVAVLMEKIQGSSLWSGLAIQFTWVLLCFLMASVALPTVLAVGPLARQDWLPEQAGALVRLMADRAGARQRLAWALQGISLPRGRA